MGKFNVAAIKAAQAKATGSTASGEKGPVIPFTASEENGHLVIRIPLNLTGDQMRMTKPNEKTGISLPSICGIAKLPESLPVTVTDGDDTLTFWTHTNYAFNVTFSYQPQKPNVTDEE